PKPHNSKGKPRNIMGTFGDQIPASSSGQVQLDDDVYDAQVTEVSFVTDGEGKKKVSFSFKLSGVYDGEGKDVILRRRFGATFAANKQTQAPSLLTKCIAALTGIPTSDTKRMEGIDPQRLVDRWCRVSTVYSAQSGYTNIENVLAPPKKEGAGNGQ